MHAIKALRCAACSARAVAAVFLRQSSQALMSSSLFWTFIVQMRVLKLVVGYVTVLAVMTGLVIKMLFGIN